MTQIPDTTRERPLALVTGASSGIRLELAKQLAGMAEPGSGERDGDDR